MHLKFLLLLRLWRAPRLVGDGAIGASRRPWLSPPRLTSSYRSLLASKRDRQRTSTSSSSRVLEGKCRVGNERLEGSAWPWLRRWLRVRATTRYYSLSSGMPDRALRASSPTYVVRAHVIGESAPKKCKMAEELPILKGILNGVVNYHNARRCFWKICLIFTQLILLSLTLLSSSWKQANFSRVFSNSYCRIEYFLLSPHIFLTVLSRCRAADTRPTRAPGIYYIPPF